MMRHATARDTNVAVRAAAGTGKTWLLTSRIIRLLLQEAAPGSILAITFTRKAAADIYRRVSERLLSLVTADESELTRQVESLGISPTRTHLQAARRLFEDLLASEQELRTTTFHAFCQDVLRRFPVEAEVAPGFVIIESTRELEHAAWHALEHEATANPNSMLACAIDTLLRHCGGIANTRQALNEFLKHRSDWWAYTEGERDPIVAAESRLLQTLKIAPDDDPTMALRQDGSLGTMLTRYIELLEHYPSAANQQRLNQLARSRDPTTPAEEAFDLLTTVFLTKKAKPRRLRRSSRLAAMLGSDAVDELFDLHDRIITRLQRLRERRLRLRTFTMTCAWYRCGERLLDHYQRLKAEQNILDFADLEWKTYRLLNNSHYAEWIQYKLDEHIDHLLVDEFQDTNPTQWRLLLPLLEEMAAGKTQRQRSVFLVGDEKQSIYRFRRADPDLFNAAQEWLTNHMQATTLTQDRSWRSSAAIVEFVNLVFADPPATSDKTKSAATDFMLANFRVHDTRHRQRWGRVELLPIIPRKPSETDDSVSQPLRNPLEQPRSVVEDERYRAEAQLVADKIRRLIGQPIDDDGVRPLEYGDIMILLRDRTHAPAYEAALRHAAIPYVGAGRQTFLACLEVRDLIHLLQCLVASYDNLALASALRCPIFACDDRDLTLLAATHNDANWQERLHMVAEQLAFDHPLARAQRLIERWSAAADRIPVHDLLDKIYSEGNVIARYISAAPPHLRNRVEVNLRRLLELALEVDHGRYPSVMRFLTQLPMVADEDRYASAETFGDDCGYVRLMTIHAAKGLEKPVVFLVDTMRDRSQRAGGMRALIDWPVTAPRPRHFRLVGKQRELDTTSQQLVSEQTRVMQREEASLLYVGLTRAKHMLSISACESGRGALGGWYGFIERRVRAAVAGDKRSVPGLRMSGSGAGIVLEQGISPTLPPHREVAVTPSPPRVDPALAEPLPPGADVDITYPSHAPVRDDYDDTDNVFKGMDTSNERLRGTVIHRMLTVLTEGPDRSGAKAKVAHEISGMLPTDLLDAYWREACDVVDDPAFKAFFNPSCFQQARNELPVLYRHAGRNVYGLVDRLVIYPDKIAIIDYKTHDDTTRENIEHLAQQFEGQMRLYATGIRKVYPSKTLRVLLLFTARRAIVDLTSATNEG